MYGAEEMEVEVNEHNSESGKARFNPNQRVRFTRIVISVDSQNSRLCGQDCLYRNQHPVSPRCSNPLMDNGRLEWEDGFEGLKRCPKCISLFG